MLISNVNEITEKQNITAVSEKRDVFTELTEDAAKKAEEVKDTENKEDKNNGYSMTISEEAKQLFLEQLEETKENNPYTDLIKLIEIANRISKGDKVPLSDEKKLLEEDPDMYLSAKTIAAMNENKKPKNYKALFDDEENSEMDKELRELKRENSTAESSDSGEISEIDMESGNGKE